MSFMLKYANLSFASEQMKSRRQKKKIPYDSIKYERKIRYDMIFLIRSQITVYKTKGLTKGKSEIPPKRILANVFAPPMMETM